MTSPSWPTRGIPTPRRCRTGATHSTRATVYTDLPGAEGLKNGDEVRIAGVKAGTVKKVTFSTEMPA